MALKIYKPTSPGRRGVSKTMAVQVGKKEPEKQLTKYLKEKAGRSAGQITVRHRGAGVKKLYRLIDFKQDKYDIPARVEALEYDPNRTAWLALLCYQDGERRYIIAPQDLKIGDKILSSKTKIET